MTALHDGDLDAIYRPRLRDLKRARRGRRCFVIGNGPSLARIDLSRLKGEATFATDRFNLNLPDLDWTPTYYVVDDKLVAEDRAGDLSSLSGTTKLYPATLADVLRPDDSTIYFDHRPPKSSPTGFDFSFDADQATYAGGTVTFTCLQLAAYLGFLEIYLVGVDAGEATGERRDEPNLEVMLGAYAEARRATEARGVSVVNATVGGNLEVFPRIDFDVLFEAAPQERLLVLDHTRMGNATASGEVKAAILANWPRDRLLQVYDGGRRGLRVDGEPAAGKGSRDLVEKVEAFAPDVVLYRPVPRTPALHAFAMNLLRESDLPLAVWIVDDWPAALRRSDPEAAHRLEADFRWLLARGGARFSISTFMSAAFHDRYGHPFVPIANGVDPADWAPAVRREPAEIKVRYAGSLAENMTLATVEMVARAVDRLAAAGLAISMEVKTHRHWLENTREIEALEHATISTSDLSLPEYRRWLAEADILVIAYNFDAASREYIQYSLANKLPECLASGAAVLAVGPSDVGTIATLAAIDIGERVTVCDEELVANALRRLAESPDLRFDLAARAQSVAFSQFDLAGTRQAFESTVARLAADDGAGEYSREVHAHTDETAVVATLLRDRHGARHVMLDVGAHEGSSAVKFDRLGWSIHCFEPHPVTRKALESRFRKHGNVRIDPRAVGEQPARDLTFYDSPESTGIASLEAFHATHRVAGRVDVTTVGEVIRDRHLERIDFLKIDVEGLDFDVLKGVPWAILRPDVIECEFEDAKTIARGHTWRDMAAYLRELGYVVYVSEWHPIVRYGVRHDWRRVVPFDDGVDVDPRAWGNLLAFVDDPGWPAVRRAFAGHLERGAPRATIAPARKGKARKRPSLARRIARRIRRAGAAVLGRRP